MISLFMTLCGYISSFLSTQVTFSYGYIISYFFISAMISSLNQETKFIEKSILGILEIIRYVKKEIANAFRRI